MIQEERQSTRSLAIHLFRSFPSFNDKAIWELSITGKGQRAGVSRYNRYKREIVVTRDFLAAQLPYNFRFIQLISDQMFKFGMASNTLLP